MATAPHRIDVHAHMVPDFWSRAQIEAGHVPTSGAKIVWSPQSALEIMDAHGIATEILSISFPGVHFGDNQAAAKLARQCNEYAGELRETHKGRFGGFAVLPLPDVDGAIAELEVALDTLKLDGVVLLASYAGRFLGDPQFDRLLAALNERKAVAFIHPGMHPSTKQVGLPWPGFMLEFVVDTSRAAMNLLFSGALERYPDIKFILAHGGGVIPYIAGRLSVAPLISPLVPQWSQEKILSGLRRFWYDTALSATRHSLPTLLEVAAPEHVLFGSDLPYAPPAITKVSIAGLAEAPVVSDALRQGIERDHALALFPRLAGVSRR